MTTRQRYPSARSSLQLATSLFAFAFLACGAPAQERHPQPAINSVSPGDGATAVPLDAKLSVVFDRAMQPILPSEFTVKRGVNPVDGKVTTSADGLTATFAPSVNLAAGSDFTATIASGATSEKGVALGANHVWTFSTVAAAGAVPVVRATNPVAGSSGVAINTKISATFSSAMDPLTITNATFTVTQGNAQVAGTVSYGPGATATFSPTTALAASTLFTATVTNGVKDLAGKALASPFSWSFTTGTTAALGPSPVLLGSAGNYAILAKSAISTVPASAVTGDIGLGPAAATYLTGFSLVADSTNVFASSPQVVGKVFAANYAMPTPTSLTTAVSDMETAYTDAASRPTPDFLELGTGNIGGKTLAPGLYKWTSTVTIPADVVISGSANDVWIFQTTGDLTMSAGMRVNLSGGALAKNIFWQVAGKATLGTNSHFEGVLLCQTEVTLQTGASMNGRLLAQTQVALQQATLTQPAQ